MEDGNNCVVRELRFRNLVASALSERHNQLSCDGSLQLRVRTLISAGVELGEELSVEVVVKAGTSAAGSVTVEQLEGRKTLVTLPATSAAVMSLQ